MSLLNILSRFLFIYSLKFPNSPVFNADKQNMTWFLLMVTALQKPADFSDQTGKGKAPQRTTELHFYSFRKHALSTHSVLPAGKH